jgi:signal transduction histidine kinase
MRLGTKFALLIMGTVATPLLAMSLVALIVFVGTPSATGPAETIRAVIALHDLRQRRVVPSEVPAILRAVAPHDDLLIVDENNTTIFSSFDMSLRETLLDNKWQTHTFSRVTLTAPNGKPFAVVIGFHASGTPQPWLGGLTLLIVIGSLVGFMTLMSIVIIRSINASIARLEEGTRRISAGDLDFELPVKVGGDRIASLTRSFEEMRRRVRQDAEARSRFIMSVSHDLKTPLSSITGYLDAINDGMASEPPQLAKYLAIIRDKTGLLESRISQLIDYVKLETGEWKRSRETAALAPFLMEAATVFATEAEVRGFAFDSAIDVPQGVTVLMDEDLVYRALENLVQNAFRYAEPGSTLRFVAESVPSAVRVRVTNRGVINEKDLPFIFEPFYRGTRSRRDSGFGLGLSVVKWVVSSHGWTIDAACVGGETSFTIGIPK